MANSLEFLTVRACSGALETALQGDRELVYHLNNEGFITDEACDSLLDAQSMLTAAQKAGQLVSSVRKRIKVCPQDYQELVAYLSRKERYGSIVQTLDSEYSTLGELSIRKPMLANTARSLHACAAKD